MSNYGYLIVALVIMVAIPVILIGVVNLFDEGTTIQPINESATPFSDWVDSLSFELKESDSFGGWVGDVLVNAAVFPLYIIMKLIDVLSFGSINSLLRFISPFTQSLDYVTARLGLPTWAVLLFIILIVIFPIIILINKTPFFGTGS